MPKFKHGTKKDSKNYLTISAGPHRGTRVHTLVAEAMLGRKLRPEEEINHVDGNKLNPEWTNLKVLGKAEHGAVSNRQRWFLKHKAAHERKQWEDWINNGGARPDEAEVEAPADAEAEDVSFNTDDLEGVQDNA